MGLQVVANSHTEGAWRTGINDVAATVIGDVDQEHDWSQILSVGEQQRCAFIRALLARPT